MPRMTQAHVEARRRQILEAAFLSFAEQGFQGSTLRAISKRAGLSPGTIYLYFESKEQIVRELADLYGQEQKNLMDSTVQVKSDFGRALAWGLGKVLDRLRDPRMDTGAQLDLNIWAESTRNPDLLKLVEERFERIHTPLRRLIQRGQDGGELSPDVDASTMAYLIIAITTGLELHRVFFPQMDVDAFAQGSASLFRGTFVQGSADKTAASSGYRQRNRPG